MGQHHARRLRSIHLFAGAGGGILGDLLLGHLPVCAVELDPYCTRVLIQRQRDGVLPWFPVWDDARTFDGTPWRGRVDIVAGGFPCTPHSHAGLRQGGSDERNLWPDMARIIGEVRPPIVWIENVPGLLSSPNGVADCDPRERELEDEPDEPLGYMGVVLSDLAALGYHASWGVIGAHHAGAPHKRDRLWIKGVAARPATAPVLP